VTALLAKLKPIAAHVLRDYEAYWIFQWQASGAGKAAAVPSALLEVSEIEAAQLHALPAQTLREQAWYAGQEARAFLACWQRAPAALCFYWYGERYRARNFWPLRAGEAKLVQIIVDPPYRGRGIATQLIRASAQAMAAERFRALYGRVWVSNAASAAAFRSAGWERIALVCTGLPFGMQRRVRSVMRWRR
jgi:ribosomal protein S18 acetylase RimI-like enzyme